MKKNLIVAALAACAGLFCAPPALAQKHKIEVINVAATSEGDKIRGPRSIKPRRVNSIRYRVEVKTETEFKAGPSLALPFIPQIPGGGGGDAAGGANFARADLGTRLTSARGTPEQEFGVILDALAFLTKEAADIVTETNTLIADTNKASDATRSFVRESDALLAGLNGPDAVVARIPGVLQKIRDADRAWPDARINTLLADVDIWEGELNRISNAQWLADNKARVDDVRGSFQRLRERTTALSHNGQANSPAALFDEAQRSLGGWKEIFLDVVGRTAAEGGPTGGQGVAYFDLPYVDVGCRFSFDQSKETLVKLVKQDRLAAEPTTTEQELITVICSSPFSVSGGFGFSSVNEREFVFVQSTKPVTENGQTTQQVINRFGFKNNSSFRPIPMLLLNTRIHEWDKWDDTFALHLSAGAGVDIKTGEAGSDVEFIVGPTVSFKRSLFVTGGFHIGRVPKLAGGFELGQEVPEGIDAPPIEKAWKPGFIVGITFKLR